MSKILIIDDNELVAKLLQEALENDSYQVAVGFDANQGYATAITFQPDLILLDVHLPDLLGFDLVNILKGRKDLERIPIIMITGSHLETQHKVRAFKSGVDDYITKPFEIPELLERVAAVLRRSQNSPSPAAEPETGAAIAPAAAAAAETPAFVIPAAAGAEDARPRTNLGKAVFQMLWASGALSAQGTLPQISVLYLLSANGLALAGLTVAAGSTIKPVAAVLLVSGCWGLAVSCVVMMSSLLGLRLGWAEGSRLLSLAAIPLLLRLLGGCVFSLVTTLSPFLFSAGPALFAKNPAGLLEGLDLSVLWTVYLCGRFLEPRDPRRRKGWMVAGGLWCFFMAVGLVARKFF